jgi:hypothetical protein
VAHRFVNAIIEERIFCEILADGRINLVRLSARSIVVFAWRRIAKVCLFLFVIAPYTCDTSMFGD